MAAAEARDVRDVLGIPESSKVATASTSASATASSSRPSRSRQKSSQPSQSRQSRPEGVTRELYALLGDHAPSLSLSATSVGAPKVGTDASGTGKKFRSKYQRRLKPARKWDWVPFTNPARSDGLVLYHWVPAASYQANISAAKEEAERQSDQNAKTSASQSGKTSTTGDDQTNTLSASSSAETVQAEKTADDKKDGSDGDDDDDDVEMKEVASSSRQAAKARQIIEDDDDDDESELSSAGEEDLPEAMEKPNETPEKSETSRGNGKEKEGEGDAAPEDNPEAGVTAEKEAQVQEEPMYESAKRLRPKKVPETEYSFAQFNTTSGVYSYSNEEYAAYLKDDNWSKEETDYLIDLCHAYDLRFIVIHDRYEWPDGPSRTIEDLKNRYQTICRRLIRSRPSSDPPELRSALLLSYNFDRNREIERKKTLKRLYARTPSQLAEEEALYIEARRLEQQEAKFAREREALLKLLGGWEAAPNWTRESLVGAGTGLSLAGLVSGPLPPSLAVGSANAATAAAATAAAVAAAAAAAAVASSSSSTKGATGAGGDGSGTAAAAGADISTGDAAGADRKKKRKFGADAEDFLGLAASATVGSVQSAAEIAARQQILEDERQGIMRFDPEQSPTPPKPPPHLVGTLSSYPPIAPSTSVTSSHGVYLRSTRTVTPRANLLQKTMESLAELQPTPIPQRLVFPTRSNIERWEGLVGALSAGLEMKRARERAEVELSVQEARLNAALEREKERKKKAASVRATVNSLSAQS
ncbi:swr complex subunit [Tilletia horrida]|nr:swr complex subunit [Tilletia horrida]